MVQIQSTGVGGVIPTCLSVHSCLLSSKQTVVGRKAAAAIIFVMFTDLASTDNGVLLPFHSLAGLERLTGWNQLSILSEGGLLGK